MQQIGTTAVPWWVGMWDAAYPQRQAQLNYKANKAASPAKPLHLRVMAGLRPTDANALACQLQMHQAEGRRRRCTRPLALCTAAPPLPSHFFCTSILLH